MAKKYSKVVYSRLIPNGCEEYYGPWGDCEACGKANVLGSRFCNGCGARLDERKAVAADG